MSASLQFVELWSRVLFDVGGEKSVLSVWAAGCGRQVFKNIDAVLTSYKNRGVGLKTFSKIDLAGLCKTPSHNIVLGKC